MIGAIPARRNGLLREGLEIPRLNRGEMAIDPLGGAIDAPGEPMHGHQRDRENLPHEDKGGPDHEYPHFHEGRNQCHECADQGAEPSEQVALGQPCASHASPSLGRCSGAVNSGAPPPESVFCRRSPPSVRFAAPSPARRPRAAISRAASAYTAPV